MSNSSSTKTPRGVNPGKPAQGAGSGAKAKPRGPKPAAKSGKQKPASSVPKPKAGASRVPKGDQPPPADQTAGSSASKEPQASLKKKMRRLAKDLEEAQELIKTLQAAVVPDDSQRKEEKPIVPVPQAPEDSAPITHYDVCPNPYVNARSTVVKTQHPSALNQFANVEAVGDELTRLSFDQQCQNIVLRDGIYGNALHSQAPPTVVDWTGDVSRNEFVAGLFHNTGLSYADFWRTAPTFLASSSFGNAERRPFLVGEQYDYMTCFDVYRGSANGPFDAQHVRMLLKTAPRIIWVGRSLRGKIGGDDAIEGVEGAFWYETNGAKFLVKGNARPEQVFPVDWLFEYQNYGGVAIERLTTVGPYTVFMLHEHHDEVCRPCQKTDFEVNLTEDWIQDPMEGRSSFLRFARDAVNRSIEGEGLLGSIFGDIAGSIVKPLTPVVRTFHVKTWNALSLTYATKLPYGYNLDAALTQVEQAFLGDPLLRRLAKVSPSSWSCLRLHTALAVMYRSRQDTVSDLHSLRMANNPNELDLVEARQARTVSQPEKPTTSVAPLLKATVAAAVCAGVFAYMRRTPSSLPLRQAYASVDTSSILPTIYGWSRKFWDVQMFHPDTCNLFAAKRWRGNYLAHALGFSAVSAILFGSKKISAACAYAVGAAVNIAVARDPGLAVRSVGELIPLNMLNAIMFEEAFVVFPSLMAGVLKVGFGFFEFALYVSAGIPVPMRIPALIMHIGNARLLAKGRAVEAIFCHAVFNDFAALAHSSELWAEVHRVGWAPDNTPRELVGPFISFGFDGKMFCFPDPSALKEIPRGLYACFRCKRRGVVLASCFLASLAASLWSDTPVQTFDEPRAFRDFAKLHSVGQRNQPTTTFATIPAGVVLRPLSSQFKVYPSDRPFRGTIQIRVDDVPMSINEALGVLSLADQDDSTSVDYARNVMHPICVTNGLLFEPAKTDYNLLVALVLRIHNDPFVGAPDAAIRHASWRDLAIRMIEDGLMGYPGALATLDIEEACKLMGKNGQRILNAWYELNTFPKDIFRKTVFLKWNETITANKALPDGRIGIKPRVITNLEPSLHALMSPMARALADRLHELWNEERTYIVGDYVATIVFASGYNQPRLSYLAECFENSAAQFYVIISGDDSVFRERDFVHEGDLTAQDQSEDEGPLHYFLDQILAHMKAPMAFRDIAHRSVVANYRFYGKRLKIKGTAGVQQPTGTTLTTVVNSLVCGAAFLNYIYQKSEAQSPSLSESFLNLGFGLKDKTVSWEQATFLKGWWRRDIFGKPIWLPLISAAVKIGKILVDPSHLFKNSPAPYAAAANAVACSYGRVPENYPVLGPLLAKMRGNLGETARPGLVESYNVQYTKVEQEIVLLRSEALAAVCVRYGISPRDVDRVETLIRNSALVFPIYLEDPLFMRLAEVDYE